ncbi:MAG TPA: hypothetical protein DEP45_00575 [Armatimonadetes bacterium]|nr:hypothetical protein [Armatimonadota bacterium]
MLQLDDRQKVLAGLTLFLILAHLIFPKSGVDEGTVALLGFFTAVLYGKEFGRSLRIGLRMAIDAPERRAAREAAQAPASVPAPAQAELAERVRQISYQAEHARIAAESEGLPPGARMGDVAWGIVQRSSGQPRVALMLTLRAVEQRLEAATGLKDISAAIRRLVETSKAPRQLAEALEAWRRARNDVAQAVNGGITDDALWALVDIGAMLVSLIPNGGPAPSTEN